jgi:hypothetical protein
LCWSLQRHFISSTYLLRTTHRVGLKKLLFKHGSMNSGRFTKMKSKRSIAMASFTPITLWSTNTIRYIKKDKNHIIWNSINSRIWVMNSFQTNTSPKTFHRSVTLPATGLKLPVKLPLMKHIISTQVMI